MNLPPIDATGLNVHMLPVKPREPADDTRMLAPVPDQLCNHWNTSFEIDEVAAKCTCKACGTEVSAMFVLKRLMEIESRWMRTRAAYQEEMQRLGERSKTKCQHCGAMTRISNR